MNSVFDEFKFEFRKKFFLQINQVFYISESYFTGKRFQWQSKSFLQAFSEVELTTCSGNEFQLLMILTVKKFPSIWSVVHAYKVSICVLW